MAMVSLTDYDRQWFKSCTGSDATETPRGEALCPYAVTARDIVYVADARGDPRFADTAVVAGELHDRGG